MMLFVSHHQSIHPISCITFNSTISEDHLVKLIYQNVVLKMPLSKLIHLLLILLEDILYKMLLVLTVRMKLNLNMVTHNQVGSDGSEGAEISSVPPQKMFT